MGEFSSALLHGLILLLLLGFVFPGVFLRGEAISPSDMLGAIPPWRGYVDQDGDGLNHKLMSDVITAFHPYYALTRAALDRGEWPLWNPLEYSGMPLLANCQSSVFYPPRLFHAFVDVRVATTFFIILKLWLCGMMAYACARGIRLSRGASRFFSVGWMLASYNLIWANWSLPDVSAWVPLLFLGIELLLDGRYRRGFFAMLAGGTLIFLAGHPETALTMCLGLGLYFVLRLALDGRRGRRLWAPVGVAAGAAVLSLLVCLPVILPFIEYLLNSHTFFARAEKVQYPVNAGAVVSFWLPRFFGASIDKNFWGAINSNLISMFYSGIGVWAGISLLMAKRQTLQDTAPPGRFAWIKAMDHRVAALFAVTVVMVLLAFDAPGVRALNRLPVLSSTLICYHASFALFGFPLLGAIGLDRFMGQRRRLRELGWLVAVACVVGGLIAYEYRFSSVLIRMMKVDSYIQQQILVSGLLALGALIVLAGFCFYPNRAIWSSALVVLLAGDLIYANRGLNPTMPLNEVFPETKLTRHLRSLGDHRIGFPEGNIPSGLMAPYGLEDWQAYDGLYPQRMWRFTNDMGEHLWGKFEPLRSIVYYLNDPAYPPVIPKEKMPRLEPVAQMDGLQVLKNNDALPRAYLVPRLETAPGVSELIAKLVDPAFEPRETALTEAHPPHSLPASNMPAAELGTARVMYRGGTRVVVEAEAKAECVLVLSDAYYPGWTATIDTTPAEIFPAYYVYRGLLLPAGQHEIVYTYMPWTFKAGMAASVVTLVTGLLAGLILLRHGHQRLS
ncbi:MAG TPA: hypothetical protein VMZ06_18325 [Candidatus Bathyarchaeia archaeon]|nr:hypothetical protein [Candidatus Bathyarchaeia archaeon]